MDHITAPRYPHNLSQDMELLPMGCKGELNLLLNLKLLFRISQASTSAAQINENGFDRPRTALIRTLVRPNEYGKPDLSS